MSAFEPMVYGVPSSRLSKEEVDRIIEDARQNGQNVYFGSETQDQRDAQLLYASQPPVQTSFFAILAAIVSRWF